MIFFFLKIRSCLIQFVEKYNYEGQSEARDSSGKIKTVTRKMKNIFFKLKLSKATTKNSALIRITGIAWPSEQKASFQIGSTRAIASECFANVRQTRSFAGRLSTDRGAQRIQRSFKFPRAPRLVVC